MVKIQLLAILAQIGNFLIAVMHIESGGDIRVFNPNVFTAIRHVQILRDVVSLA
jgi:hypothetical protein